MMKPQKDHRPKIPTAILALTISRMMSALVCLGSGAASRRSGAARPGLIFARADPAGLFSKGLKTLGWRVGIIFERGMVETPRLVATEAPSEQSSLTKAETGHFLLTAEVVKKPK
jgi:hypothetical protein